MPAATKKKRKWAGLVCPVCRFVFRVPKDHGGSGVVCPACHHLLKIPARESKVAPAGAPGGDSPVSPVAGPRGERAGKPIVSRPMAGKDAPPVPRSGVPHAPDAGPQLRRRKSRPQEAPGWESAAPQSGSGHSDLLAWTVGGALLVLAVVGLGAWLVIDSVTEPGNDRNALVETPAAGSPAPLVNREDEMNEEEKKRQQEISASVKAGLDALTDAEDVVRKFLTAKTIDGLEPLIRTPGTTMPRIRRWYAEDKWTPPGAREIGCGGKITVRGMMASMAVRLDDYSVKQIALERTPDGYKVDWESWVAWTSVPWGQLFEKRPTEPVEVRVRCARDHYYNRLFSDDTKWQAVRLEHPGSEKTIYGYIDRNSPSLVSLLGSLGGDRGVAEATVTIRYPEDTVADNQVYICEYLYSGWVSPNGGSKPAPQKQNPE